MLTLNWFLLLIKSHVHESHVCYWTIWTHITYLRSGANLHEHLHMSAMKHENTLRVIISFSFSVSRSEKWSCEVELRWKMIQRNVPVSIQVKPFVNTENNFSSSPSFKDCVFSNLQWKSMGQESYQNKCQTKKQKTNKHCFEQDFNKKTC